MKEIADILIAFDEAAKLGKKAALATVVLVEGSAYRRAGARMLITEDGQLTGAISGGCLEGDALRKACLVILQQQAMLVTYDTTDDDDAKLGVGLGCNGIIHILIEPIIESSQTPIDLLRAVTEGNTHAVLITLFSLEHRKALQPGTCLYFAGATYLERGVANSNLRELLLNDAERVLKSHCSETNNYIADITYTGFVEHIHPVISLVIAGAGNDAIPLTKIAAVLGWNVIIADGRHNYALSERFPLAKKVVVARPEELLSHIKLNEWTAFVLMTHNYIYELNLLHELLPLNLPYIGVLGPKKKLERMLAELEETGTWITGNQLDNVYGPVGLDIGSEGAEEIALSIIAEIKAVLSSRNGLSLKFKPVPIHTQQLNTVEEK